MFVNFLYLKLIIEFLNTFIILHSRLGPYLCGVDGSRRQEKAVNR